MSISGLACYIVSRCQSTEECATYGMYLCFLYETKTKPANMYRISCKWCICCIFSVDMVLGIRHSIIVLSHPVMERIPAFPLWVSCRYVVLHCSGWTRWDFRVITLFKNKPSHCLHDRYTCTYIFIDKYFWELFVFIFVVAPSFSKLLPVWLIAA